MADITAGLPTLSPEDVQAQQDRARLAALGQTVNGGAQRLGAAFNDLFTMPARAVLGAANTALRVPNAFGASIPYIPDNGLLMSPTPYSDALPRLSGGNTGAPTGSFAPVGAPAMTATAPGAAPVVSNAAPASSQITPTNDTGATATATARAPAQAPRTAGARNPAGMPAAAPAPLVPGETGFYIGDQLVPYGTSMEFRGGGLDSYSTPGGGGGGASTDNLPGGGKIVNGRFADPRDALEYGFRLQSQYRDDSIRSILSSAGSGSELGYRARVAALAQAFGANNFGADSVGGANSLNQAIAHITGAEIGAGATIGAAQLGAGSQAAHTAELARQFNYSDQPIGQTSTPDPATGLMVTTTHYGSLPGMPQRVPIDAALPKAKPVPGKIYKDRSGNQATYNADGTYTPLK